MNTLSVRIEESVREKLAAYGAPRGMKPTQVARMFLLQTISALESKSVQQAVSDSESVVATAGQEAIR